jgi:hypothetical protein
MIIFTTLLQLVDPTNNLPLVDGFIDLHVENLPIVFTTNI